MASAASAHVVYQRRTLRQWAQQADIIIVAEILSPLKIWSAEDGSDHQEYFSLRVVERVAGEAVPDSLDIFPHAEGEPRYRVGDRALLFLDRSAARAEFAPLATRFPYFTTQGAGHEWVLSSPTSEAPAIALAWRHLRGAGDYEERRDLLLRELSSADRRLRGEAIADLVQMRSSPAFRSDSATLAKLAAMARSEKLDVGERISLIHVLDGTPAFSSGDEMLALAKRTDDPRQRLRIIRACGSIRDAAVTAWLQGRLAEAEPAVRVATLNALAHPWHVAAVNDVIRLATATETKPRVGAAAVRALGGIGGPTATAALRDIAQQQRAPTAALARGELARLQSGSPSTGGALPGRSLPSRAIR